MVLAGAGTGGTADNWARAGVRVGFCALGAVGGGGTAADAICFASAGRVAAGAACMTLAGDGAELSVAAAASCLTAAAGAAVGELADNTGRDIAGTAGDRIVGVSAATPELSDANIDAGELGADTGVGVGLAGGRLGTGGSDCAAWIGCGSCAGLSGGGTTLAMTVGFGATGAFRPGIGGIGG